MSAHGSLVPILIYFGEGDRDDYHRSYDLLLVLIVYQNTVLYQE